MDIINSILGGLGLNNPASGDADARVNFIVGLVRNGIVLLFVVVVIAGIVYAALAGLKYIQSQGASDKVEEAQGALKSVLIGVAAAFVGVIGVIVISAIFADGGSANDALKCFLGDFDSCSTVNDTPATPDAGCIPGGTGLNAC